MKNKEIVLLKKLDERAVIPTYAHNGDLGLDCTAIDVEYNEEYDYYVYRTGLALENDYGKAFLLFPRSSNRKKDCYLANSVGIADTAIYRGEIVFTFKNRTSMEMRRNVNIMMEDLQAIRNGNTGIKYIKHTVLDPMGYAPYKVGDKIGQLVLVDFPNVEFKVVEELNESERGTNGHGSTGE